jgi:site-specific DNA-methyltransferase (adenine-specific)/modification methylase
MRAPYQLHNKDCAEVIPTLAEVSAVITDPPYGISYSPKQNSSKAWGAKTFVGDVVVRGDDKPFDPTPLLNFQVIVLCGANHFADKLPSSSEWIIWDKREGMTSNDFADCELIWTNGTGVARLFRHLWSGAIRASEKGIERVHPTQKPLALMRYLIEKYTQTDDIVFDPYMGSGTTGVAALQLGRRFIGCEIDPKYFAIAERRISQAAQQPALLHVAQQSVQRTGGESGQQNLFSAGEVLPAKVTAKSPRR